MKFTAIGGTALAAIVASAGTMAWAQDTTPVSFGSNPPVKIVAPKGMSASSYGSILFNNYTNILSSNGPVGRYISPADVVVLCPPASLAVLNGKAPAPPTPTTKPLMEATLSPKGTYLIYVMARRFLTVDPLMAAANGMTSSAALATKLARQYMQTFPRECFRPPSLPALSGVPPHPPLRLTSDLSQCIPLDVRGRVGLFGRGLFNLAAVQADGSSGPDRAGILTSKTSRLMGNPTDHKPEDITFVKAGKLASVMVGTVELYTVSDADAKANGYGSAAGLAKILVLQIAKRIQDATPAVVPAPETPPATVPAVPAAPPVTPPTTPPATPPAQ